MGKVLIISRAYKIKEGILNGLSGILVAYDAYQNEAILQLDGHVKVITTSENLELN